MISLARPGSGERGSAAGRKKRPAGKRGVCFAPRLEALEDRTLLSWATVASMPTPRSGLAAVTGPDGRIYAIGGLDILRSPEPLATVEAYMVATNTWTTVASLPTPRQLLAAAVGPDGRIYALGGADAAGNPLHTVEAYSIITNTWAAALPLVRELLARPGDDPEVEPRLRWLLAVGQQALKEGNHQEAMRVVREAQPLSARRAELAAEFEKLEKEAHREP